MDHNFCLKLFLSIDISGSTYYKETVNLKHLRDRLNKRQELFDIIYMTIVKESTDTSKHNQNKEELKELINKALYKRIPTEDADWGSYVQNILSDFHVTFMKSLTNYQHYQNDHNHSEERNNLEAWKALGDEIIYVCDIESRQDLHILISAFSIALRTFDKKLKEKRYLKLKGSAWVADFPVKNRIVELPFFQSKKRFPREDYLGPDMDLGFRIGKESWPGFLAITMEVIQLLATYDNSKKIQIYHVGWKYLKGIWEGHGYPIFWATANKNILGERKLDYCEYTESELSHNSYLERYTKISKRKEQHPQTYAELINRIKEQLPDKIWVPPPFIPKEDGVPKEIKKLQSDLSIILEPKKEAPIRTVHVKTNSLKERLSYVRSQITIKNGIDGKRGAEISDSIHAFLPPS